MADNLGDIYFNEPYETNIYANEFGVITDEDVPNNTTSDTKPHDTCFNIPSVRYTHQATEEGIYDELSFEDDFQCVEAEIYKDRSPRIKSCNHFKTWLIVVLIILVLLLGGALLFVGLTSGFKTAANNQGNRKIEDVLSSYPQYFFVKICVGVQNRFLFLNFFTEFGSKLIPGLKNQTTTKTTTLDYNETPKVPLVKIGGKYNNNR